MSVVSDKVMFEIYREAGYGRKYRVVYFTELDDHNKESEINRALAGEHFFDGFLANKTIDKAKGEIDCILDCLNNGQAVTPTEVQRIIQSYGV